MKGHEYRVWKDSQEIINERIITAVACTPWDAVGVRRIMGVIESRGLSRA